MKLTIADARKKLSNKEISAVELTEAHFAEIEKQRDLNAYILETKDLALEKAQAFDNGEISGLMAGIPVGVKDLFCTKDVRTTACSKMLENFVPGYESTVSQKLFDQGAIMLGKLNMDEFAMGSTNKTSYFGAVKNPWKRGDGAELVPGGSSGGSAAAVAAHLAMGTLGSDTGGSIRQPAAFCGIVGVKPTYGRCSRWGMVAFASSLDQAGVFTRNVEDSAIMLEAICGYDVKDSTSTNIPVDNFSSALNGSLKGKKIGIPKEYSVNGMSSEISDLWQKGSKILQDQGAEIVEISLPHTHYALAVYYIIAPAEASSNLARYDGLRYGLRVPGNSLDEMYENTRAEGFGQEVKRRILVGTYVLSAGYYDAYYKKARKVRTLIADDFKKAFTQVDAILTPATPTPAFALNEEITDPVNMYLNDVFTVPANLAGVPGMVIPAGLSESKLPLGLQILAKPFDENMMFNVAYQLEQSLKFQGR